MRILFIEDDENKIERVSGFVLKNFPESELEIQKSFQTGVRAALSSNWDLLLLDMTLPTYDVDLEQSGGYKTLHFGGKMILSELACEEKSIPAIIVTQFDQFDDEGSVQSLGELDLELIQEFGSYMGSVFYSASESAWEDELKLKIEKFSTN